MLKGQTRHVEALERSICGQLLPSVGLRGGCHGSLGAAGQDRGLLGRICEGRGAFIASDTA